MNQNTDLIEDGALVEHFTGRLVKDLDGVSYALALDLSESEADRLGVPTRVLAVGFPLHVAWGQGQ